MYSLGDIYQLIISVEIVIAGFVRHLGGVSQLAGLLAQRRRWAYLTLYQSFLIPAVFFLTPFKYLHLGSDFFLFLFAMESLRQYKVDLPERIISVMFGVFAIVAGLLTLTVSLEAVGFFLLVIPSSYDIVRIPDKLRGRVGLVCKYAGIAVACGYALGLPLFHEAINKSLRTEVSRIIGVVLGVVSSTKVFRQVGTDLTFFIVILSSLTSVVTSIVYHRFWVRD